METLYGLALTLLSGPNTGYKLALYLLGTGSELRHIPSTLMMVRLLQGPTLKAAARGTIARFVRTAEIRFTEAVKNKLHPDALAMQGMILKKQGQATKALELFGEAIEMGKSNPSKWQVEDEESPAGKDDEVVADAKERRGRRHQFPLEPTCYIGRGQIYLSRGQVIEAQDAFRVAAMELDNPDGHMELAKMLPEDSPERYDSLMRAALTGIEEAYPLLAESELRMGNQAGLDKSDVRKHRLLASEWFLLARDIESSVQARIAQDWAN
jgi:tetratricopeptide (TPR) repeat protein